jgi:hypothetical protein
MGTVRSDDDPTIPQEIRAITERYVRPDEVERYIRDWPALRTIVRITPDRVISWEEGG